MRRLIPVLALLLIVTACGDDDSTTPTTSGSTGSDSDVVESLRTQIAGDTASSGGFEVSDAEAGCFAIALVDEFGASQMADAVQMEFPEFMASVSASERRQVVDIMLDCVDLQSGLATGLGTDSAISAESASCVAEAMLDSDAFRNAVAESFVSQVDPFENEDLLADLLPAMLSCMSAEELAELNQ